MPRAVRDFTLIMEPVIAMYNEWWFAAGHFCCNEMATGRILLEQYHVSCTIQ